MVPVLLIVASAFLHALWNTLLATFSDRQAGAVIAVGGATTLAGVAAIGFGRGGQLSAEVLGWIVLAGCLEATYLLVFTGALAQGSVASVYAVARGGSVVWVWPIAALAYGEPVRELIVVGALVTALGLLGIARVHGGIRHGLGAAMIASGCIAGYHIAYKRAMAAGGEPATVFALALSLAVPILVWRLGAMRFQRLRECVVLRPGMSAFAAVACGASFLLALSALQTAGAAWVSTLRQSSVAFSQLLAVGILGERLSKAHWIATGLIVAGACLVGWPQ